MRGEHLNLLIFTHTVRIYKDIGRWYVFLEENLIIVIDVLELFIHILFKGRLVHIVLISQVDL